MYNFFGLPLTLLLVPQTVFGIFIGVNLLLDSLHIGGVSFEVSTTVEFIDPILQVILTMTSLLSVVYVLVGILNLLMAKTYGQRRIFGTRMILRGFVGILAVLLLYVIFTYAFCTFGCLNSSSTRLI
jgi:hypothetical protein